MSKKSKAIRLGIDFGTTRTVVAAVENGNYPVCSFSWEDEVKEYIPTLAAVDQGKLLFGWEAAKRLRDPEVRVLRSLKRLLGRVRPDDLLELAPGFSLPAVELVTLFLAHVKEMLFRHSALNLPKGRPLEVLAAVPANAGSNQRFITLEAFRRAGFRVRGLMNEPSAAAVEFVHRYLKDLGPKSPKKYLVVYDLGGGTFDTSVVGFAGSLFDVITHQGINRLGGDDFDQIILEKALEELGLSREELPPGIEPQLLEECRERKEGLKPNTQKMMVELALGDGKERSLILGTKEIYARCLPLIERSLEMVVKVMDDLHQFGIDSEDSQSFGGRLSGGGLGGLPPGLPSITGALRPEGPHFALSPGRHGHRPGRQRRPPGQDFHPGGGYPPFRDLAGRGGRARKGIRPHLSQRQPDGSRGGAAGGCSRVPSGSQCGPSALPGVQRPRGGRGAPG